jgi:acid phosphatase
MATVLILPFQVAYLVRQAAIFANDYDYEEYIQSFIQKLQNSTVDWKSARTLSFLEAWQYTIADQDKEQLTLVGQLEAQQLGLELSQSFLGFRPPAKVGSSTAERTTKSVRSRIQGLVRRSNETHLIEVPEGEEEGADSLTPFSSCPGCSVSRGCPNPQLFQNNTNPDNRAMPIRGICVQFHNKRHHRYAKPLRLRYRNPRLESILLLIPLRAR